jgi:hypothetical protein
MVVALGYIEAEHGPGEGRAPGGACGDWGGVGVEFESELNIFHSHWACSRRSHG